LHKQLHLRILQVSVKSIPETAHKNTQLHYTVWEWELGITN